MEMFKDKEGAKILDDYCWIHSTFTLPNEPGIKHNSEMQLVGMGTFNEEDEPVIYHKYYQVYYTTKLFFYRFLRGLMKLSSS